MDRCSEGCAGGKLRRDLTAVVRVALGVLAGLPLLGEAAPSDDARARRAPVVTLYFENDVFSGTDQDYTNGVKLSWLSADLVDWGQSGWRRDILELLPFVNREGGQKAIGFALGQNIYTPRDTRAKIPSPTDRPYAGWTYLEMAFVSKTKEISDTLSVQVGLIGPHSQAEDSQRIIHRWIKSAEPQGWDYQLRDEVGANLVYERRWRLYGRAVSDLLGVDLVPHVGASLGNVQTYANVGGTLRFGLNLPSDFGVQLARPGSLGGTPADDLDPRVALDRNTSLFLFGAVDGRAVARDLFLEGNTFRESRSVEKRTYVADWALGAGLIAGPWQLTYTQVWRTREFETQADGNVHFGSVSVSRAY
ncbi:MAG: lipid A deacylase LpxR family protein [Opitutaceae bacterium]|nr:lipid A deacylase LpxR family protein [Opitutaceae bacterium]